MFISRLILLLPLCLFHTIPLGAQDSHYWTNQYGTTAQLLGGVVVGSISDLSSTYYNPGAIALTSDERLILSTDGVELIFLSLQAENSNVKSPSSTQTRTTPSIFAYRFLTDSLQKNHWVFSFLTRRNFDFEFQGARAGKYNIINQWPGPQYISGDLYSKNAVSDIWIGVSYSRKISRRIGLGITQYAAIRSQRSRNQVLAQGAIGDTLGQSINLIERWNYTHARLLWKIGFVYTGDNFSWGINFTTPAVGILGSGTAFFQISNIANDTPPLLLSAYREEMDVAYKEPFSIALGMAYTLKNSRIYFTMEYFNKLPEFTVMDLPPVTDEDTAVNLKADLIHQMRSVFNFGMGVEQLISQNLSLYLSFLTNKSGTPPDTDSDLSFTRYNIYHIAAGGKFTLFSLNLTMGLSYGFGSSKIDVGKLELPDDLLVRDLNYESIGYNSIRLLFGIATGL